MPRGRPPEGPQALTGAERQARWRARHAGALAIRYRRPVDRRSRLQRWYDAVAELVTLEGEYEQWFEALPEALRDTATGEAAGDAPGDAEGCGGRVRCSSRT